MRNETEAARPAAAERPLEPTFPRESYVATEQFEAERERIFASEWLCVGREEVIPDAGDHLRVEPAGESILVVRVRDGGLRAFYNVCRHRGSQLVVDETPGAAIAVSRPSGRFRGSIRCPYHAWTYALTGELRAAPFLTEREGLRMGDLGLHEAGVGTWGGFVFVHLTPASASPVTTQLGSVPERLARYPLSELRIAHRIRYEVRANWKCIAENYNECYHCGPVHPELCELVPEFKRGGERLDWDRGVPHRDGATTFTLTGTTTRRPLPGLNDDERERHKGELLYPNLMLSLSPDHVAAFTLWPQAPDRTVIDCDFLFHREEMATPGFDPMDAVRFWDLVNRQDWRICESVQRGMSSRVFRFGYYAPMEDQSLDIRRYVLERLGEARAHGEPEVTR